MLQVFGWHQQRSALVVHSISHCPNRSHGTPALQHMVHLPLY